MANKNMDEPVFQPPRMAQARQPTGAPGQEVLWDYVLKKDENRIHQCSVPLKA
jgi:hypothetical protein